MANRDELGRSLSETLRIRDRALMRGKEDTYIRELEDQLESLKANIDYVQENIAECQRNIVQIEEAKVNLLLFYSADGTSFNGLLNL
jgi:kinesin family protein 4/21/27